LLKLVFYTKDLRLKVRPALGEDDFTCSYLWEDKIEFIITNDSSFTMLWSSLLPDLKPEFARAVLELIAARYPVSKNFEKLRELCPEIVFHSLSEEWVFYGGSFHPWHQGHQACLDLLPPEKTLFILPDHNPHKRLRISEPVATTLEISTKAKFKPNQFLVPTFLLENKKNPTINWVKRVKNFFPTQKLSLLLGFDSFSNLKSWTCAEELIPLLHGIYVVSRLEEEQDRIQALDEVHALGSNQNITFLGRHSFEDLSSTRLRSKK